MTQPNNILPIIGAPSGSAGDVRQLNMLVTQFFQAVNGWVLSASTAVNYLLGRTGGSTLSRATVYPGFNFVPTGTGVMVGSGFRWGTAHGSKTGVSHVSIAGTFQPSPTANSFFGVGLFYGTGTSPAAQAATTGTQIGAYQYGGGDTTIGPYHPYCLSAIIQWPAADSWFDVGVSCSTVNAGLLREYTLAIFDVAL